MAMLVMHESTPAVTPEEIRSLIGNLGSDDGFIRQKAREALVSIDGPAVPNLVRALRNPSPYMRWEAAKTLGTIADPQAAPALIEALEDESFAIRWLAAEGLVRLGQAALPPLMLALAKSAGSVWLRRGAHHVLRTLSRRSDGLPAPVEEVLRGLDDLEPALEVPRLARAAYEWLTQPDQS